VSRKRGNGEGSISYRSKERRWEARYTVYTAKGPKRRSVYGKTRAEAAAKLAKAIADRDGGVAFDTSRVTLGEYLERWLSDAVRDTVKERTLMCYERICRRHISPALGSMQLTKLKPAHLQALYKSKTDEGLSPATVRGIHVVLHKAMKQALRWDLVPRNPASGAKPPRPSDPEVTPLTKEQARQLLGTLSVEGDRFEVLYAVALATGLRIGELLGLRWQDVALDTDHSGGELRVRRTLGRTRPKREGYAGYAFGTPKGGTGRSVRFKAGAAPKVAQGPAGRREAAPRRRLRGQRPGIHEGGGRAIAPLEGVAALRVVAQAQWPTPRTLSHSEAHRGDPYAGERRTPQGGAGDVGPRKHLPDPGHLLARHAEHAVGCGRTARLGAVLIGLASGWRQSQPRYDVGGGKLPAKSSIRRTS
jgi:integrase